MQFNKQCNICGSDVLCTACEDDLHDEHVTYINPDKVFIGSGDSCIPSFVVAKDSSNPSEGSPSAPLLLPFVSAKEKQSQSDSIPTVTATKYSEL